MANRELPQGQVPYEHNGYEQIFTQERTKTTFYFNNPEMSNVSGFTGVDPSNYDAVSFVRFDKEAIVKFSGLPSDIEGKTQEEIEAFAQEITQKYGWDPQIDFALDPPDDVKERYTTHVARYIVNKALKGNVFVPEEWVEEQISSEVFAEQEQLTPDEVLIDYEVSQIGRRVLYGYFPKEWAESERAYSRNRDIFGSQLQRRS